MQESGNKRWMPGRPATGWSEYVDGGVIMGWYCFIQWGVYKVRRASDSVEVIQHDMTRVGRFLRDC